jgi:GPH family glycoside/pentoside/hexuronide:cation symporter
VVKDDREATGFTAAADRVPLREKIAYGLGTGNDLWGHWLYPAVAYPIFNISLGLAPGLVGLALALIRLFDAASDPLFGWLSDNTRTRFGRRRPYILVGSLLAGAGLPLLYFVPRGWTGSGLFWWMLASNGVYLPLISCFNMAYQSLGNELTPDYEERTSVMSFKYALSNLFQVANFAALPFTNLWLFRSARTGHQDTLLGIRVYMGLLGFVMAAIGVVIFTNVKERYYGSVAARHQAKVSIRASFYETLKCPPFRTMLLVNLAFTLGTSLLGSLGYYTTIYYVNGGNTVSGNNWNGLMGVSYMAFGIMGAPALGWVGRRTGKKAAMFLALGTALAAFGGNWFWFNPSHPWLQLIGTAAGAFGTSGFFMLSSSIGADIIDYDELSTGTRREGAFSACSSWINKAGNASGYFVSGAILTVIGFNAGLAGPQTAHTILWMRLFLSIVPVAGIGLAMVLLWRFTLTKEQAREIRTQLEARRGKI